MNVPVVPSWQSIRTHRWKYIRYTGEPETLNELYDLQTDPAEERNLIAEPSAAEQLAALRREMEQLIAKVR